jgi:type I restriction enzyme, S subunit
MSFPAFALGEIFDIARGGSPRPIEKFITDDPNGVNWISISDASSSSKYITKAIRKIIPSGVARSRAVRPGDFLLTNSMSFGRPYIMATSGCIHDGWLVLSPRKEGIDSNFMYHLLGSPAVYAEFKRLAPGATVKNLNIDLVSGVEVPLPPLDEQRRIAAILDQADTLRRKRREALQTLVLLRRSTFDDLFGDPVTNSKGWPIGRIADVTSTTQYGTSSKAGAVGTFPILRMGNLTSNGGWKLDDLKFINFEQKEIGKYTVKSGDILFNRTNSPDLVGKTAVFREAKTFGFAGYLVRLRLNDQADPEYVSAYLNSTHGKATLRGMCKSIIGMANINAKELISIPLLLPPIALQKRYAAIVSGILETERQNTAHLEGLDRMFGVLQHRAFRGEL